MKLIQPQPKVPKIRGQFILEELKLVKREDMILLNLSSKNLSILMTSIPKLYLGLMRRLLNPDLNLFKHLLHNLNQVA
jgi:hypothetical protein